MSGYNSKKRNARGNQGRGNGTTNGNAGVPHFDATGIPGVVKQDPNYKGSTPFSSSIPYSGFTGGATDNSQRTPIDLLRGFPYEPNQNGKKFGDVLGTMQGGQTDATQLLASLLSSGDRSFTEERWDMLYQYLLSLMNTSDQRNYDWSMLQDSRLYNNPQNELARLTGAGISRDAAIQILSGSAGNTGGSAIGSGALTTPAPSGISGTQELNRIGTISNAVFGSVQALNSLLSTGMSVAQGVEQVKNLQAQNYWNTQQIQSFNSVQQITQALQYMQQTGQIESSDIESLSNANDLIKFLQSKSKDNEQLAQLVQSPAYSSALGTSFGRDYFNKYWSSIRDSRNAGDILDEYLNGVRYDNAAKALQPDLIAAEMSRIGMENKVSEQEIIKLANDIAVGNAQIEYLDAQGNWVAAQTKKSQSETELIDAQTYGQLVQNDTLALQYRYNEAGFPMLVQNRIDELTLQAEKWNTLLHSGYSKGYIEQMQKAWLAEGSNAADAAYVMSLYYNAVSEFATTHPGLYQLGVCFKQSGMPELLRIGSSAATGAGALKYFTK